MKFCNTPFSDRSVEERGTLARGLLPQRIHSVVRQARRFASQCDALTPALRWILDNERMIEVYTFLPRRRSRAAQSMDGRMAMILANGTTELTAEAFARALRQMDEESALTIEQLLAAPDALRFVALQTYIPRAEQALAAQRAWYRAERWIAQWPEGGEDSLRCAKRERDPAFFEHALRLAEEQERPAARDALERTLARIGWTEAEVVRCAHEGQAESLVRLQHLLGAMRMAYEWDGAAHLAEISGTEQLLLHDPSGIYPAQTLASRAAVRSALARLAERLALSERTIARHAMTLACRRAAPDPRATLCWYLYQDEGRRELAQTLHKSAVRLPAIVPDPSGTQYMALFLGGGAVVTALAAWIGVPLVALILGLPVWISVSAQWLYRWLPRVIRPKPRLQLDLSADVPEAARTLVVVPTLLNGESSAAQMMEKLEVLGCLTQSDQIDYLLLGDFTDAKEAHQEGDEATITTAMRTRDAMNARVGRMKYHFLCRPRTYAPADRRFQGYERKRGAIQALTQWLLTGENAFLATGESEDTFRGRFPYIICLDADTRMLPGTAERLIGAMAHPLNRHFSILTPRVETLTSPEDGTFARILGGVGGLSAYPSNVSYLYQDLCGQGNFGGKGILRVATFARALEGRIPENLVLSHDLLEGMYAGTGALTDIPVFEGYPRTLSGALKRLNRWTRGDWQLLPFLKRGADLKPLDHFRILDNLVRSLTPASILALLFYGLWFACPQALAFVAVWFAGPVVMNRFRGALAALLRMAILPLETAATLSAIGQALYRLTISHRHMLDWVPAADADRQGDSVGRGGYTCALLLIPTLAHPLYVPIAVMLAIAWILVPRRCLNGMHGRKKRLDSTQIAELNALARSTWRFFEQFVTAAEHGLPPDNVQIDPALGPARRTSPTNIGLYLVACLAARELNYLSDERYEARVRETIETLGQLETWRGQFYNWYDIDRCTPLYPRYVSSVDAGNLLAGLLITEQALNDRGARDLATQVAALADAMDFEPLYDSARELFVIGIDVEHNRVSDAHYDLLASESRILSYVTLMTKGIPVRHWAHLGRPLTRTRFGPVLASWSGTMFEYLMPALFLPVDPRSLMGRTLARVARVQVEDGKKHRRPWGVSESGYDALDAALNYQYRAFGLPALALSDATQRPVIAPYASLLALPVAPSAVADNLIDMNARSWSDIYGLYEAVDFSREENGRRIMSHMAHHQGMILIALCNALTDNRIVARFMARPEAQALSLLLTEPEPWRPRLHRRIVSSEMSERQRYARRTEASMRSFECRTAADGPRLPEGTLLWGAGSTVFLTSEGQGYYARAGRYANRWHGDMLRFRDALRLNIADQRGRIPFARGHFRPGQAVWTGESADVLYTLTASVSPEDGALHQTLAIDNTGTFGAQTTVSLVMDVALCDRNDWLAHPIFQGMGVESESPASDTVVFRRRAWMQKPDETVLLVVATGGKAVRFETDRMRFRKRDIAGMPSHWPDAPFTPAVSTDPLCAVQYTVETPPDVKRQCAITLALCPVQEVAARVMAYRQIATAHRAEGLARTRAESMDQFLGLSPNFRMQLDRLSVYFADPGLSALRLRGVRPPVMRNTLWALGLSGDHRIISVYVDRRTRLENVRDAFKAHEFYQNAGIVCDLAFVNDYGTDYAQPMRDALQEMIRHSHLRDRQGVPGSVYVLDGAALSESARTLLASLSAFSQSGDPATMSAQLRARMRWTWPPRAQCPQEPLSNGGAILEPPTLVDDCDWGGFEANTDDYFLCVRPGHPLPRPWCNVLANPEFGALRSERGGGYTWYRNSRNGRLTAFDNDAVSEGFPERYYAVTRTDCLALMPYPESRLTYHVTHAPGVTEYRVVYRTLQCVTRVFVDTTRPIQCVDITLTHTGAQRMDVILSAAIAWQMGALSDDRCYLRSWADTIEYQKNGVAHTVACDMATGVSGAYGVLTVQSDGRATTNLQDIPLPTYIEIPSYAPGHALGLSLALAPKSEAHACFLLAAGETEEEVRETAGHFLSMGSAHAYEAVRKMWADRLSVTTLHTPNHAVNRMVNRWFMYQTMVSRQYARTGPYQPGGAYGFRDQLQDMLAQLYVDPAPVRAHLLRCAARQFEAGDVLHWWHMPFTGVRTHISDDLLFLPYVCAAYIEMTEDCAILAESIPYLQDVSIPEGHVDWYGVAQPSSACGSLHEHCMRAFHRADQRGVHGLMKMGTGDWNDGMNQIGVQGRGESVWLSEFAIVVARRYAPYCEGEDRAYLESLQCTLRMALERDAWDGEWYRRAYDDEGFPVGSHTNDECQIDSLTQSWAALAELDPERVYIALERVWSRLVQADGRFIRLLTPPFDGKDRRPGYIQDYPVGVRENGGQYTHAAAWFVMALAHVGDAERAWAAYQMLLPTGRDPRVYQVEPYVLAADIASEPPREGQGGWTWYTGAAAWMVRVAFASLAGYERRGNRARVAALLPEEWSEICVELRVGEATYRLISRRTVVKITLDDAIIDGEWITLDETRGIHTAVFPIRSAQTQTVGAPPQTPIRDAVPKNPARD